MKKKHLIILLASLLCLTMVFTACFGKDDEGGDDETTVETSLIDQIYDLPDSIEPEKLVSASKLDIAGSPVNYNDDFAYFVEQGATTSKHTVYNFKTNSIMLDLEDSIILEGDATAPTYTNHGVTFISIGNYNVNNHIVAVLTYSATELSTIYSSCFNILLPEEDSDYTIKVDFYDPSGSLFATLDAKAINHIGLNNLDDALNGMMLISFNTYDSLFSIDDTVYSLGTDGKIKAIKTFETTKIPNFVGRTENYYYATDSYSSSVQIFDTELNKIKTVKINLDTDDGTNEIHFLNNGDFIIQGIKELPEDADAYDFIMSEYDSTLDDYVDVKYDLTTVLFSAESDGQRDLDVKYLIMQLITAAELKYTESDTISILSGKENMAFISNIDPVKKQLSTYRYPIENADYVYMANDGSIDMSMLLSDEWLTIPTPINEDYFEVINKNYENIVIDKNGNVCFTYDSHTGASNGIYVSTDKWIYNATTGEKVLDLLENEPIVQSFNGGYLVKYKNDDGKITVKALLPDGTSKDMGEMSLTSVVSYTDYFSIKNDTTGKYDYYNTYGELLGSYDTPLSYVATLNSRIIMTDTVTNEIYLFSFNTSAK